MKGSPVRVRASAFKKFPQTQPHDHGPVRGDRAGNRHDRSWRAHQLEARAIRILLGLVRERRHQRPRFVIVTLFVATWVIALVIWRFGRIEERWSAYLEN